MKRPHQSFFALEIVTIGDLNRIKIGVNSYPLGPAVSTVFDILTRPGPDLSAKERGEIKKVAHVVLERLKTVLTLDWRKRVDARARVRLAIEDILDEGLPRVYTPELYQGECKALFEHVYKSYLGSGVSVYAPAA